MRHLKQSTWQMWTLCHSYRACTNSVTSGNHLQGQQEEERLHAVEASIYKIAHEEVVCLRAVPANLEELHEVEELTMDVTACPVKDSASVASLCGYCNQHCPYTLPIPEVQILLVGDGGPSSLRRQRVACKRSRQAVRQASGGGQ